LERIPTIGAALDEYLTSWRVGGHSPEACRARYYLLTPVRQLDGSIYDLDRRACETLILERIDAVQLVSARTFAQGLSAFLTFCVKRGWLAAHPMAGMERPRPEPKPHRYLSEIQVRAVFAACRDDHERAAVILMAGSGLRIGEVCGLRWDRVNWEEGSIEVLGKGAHGGKWRAIEASHAMPILHHLKRQGPLVFPFEHYALRIRVQRMGRDAGLGWRLKPHELRHSFAVGFLEASDEDAFTLQTVLGHSDPEMVGHYVRSVRARAAIRKMRRVDLAGRLFGQP